MVEFIFAMNDHQSQILAQAVRALSQEHDSATTTITTPEDENTQRKNATPRRRSRRAASQKASETLNKMASLNDTTQIEDEDNKGTDNNDNFLDNIDIAIRSNDMISNMKRNMKRGSKMPNVNGTRNKKKVNRKKKAQSDDEDFVLIESDKDSESENNTSIVEDDYDNDMMIDDNLKEDLKSDQNNDNDFVIDEGATKTRKKRGRKPKDPTKINQPKRQKAMSKKTIYICD